MRPFPKTALTAAMTLVLITGACDAIDDAVVDLGAVLVVPDELPAGLGLRSGCLAPDDAAAALLYRGDGRYQSAVRAETALLRVTTADVSADTFGDGDLVQSILDDAAPGSVHEVTIRGRTATAFSIPSGEDPGSVAWPSLTWTEGDLVFWIHGEGLDDDAVRLVAESLRPATHDELAALTDGAICGE